MTKGRVSTASDSKRAGALDQKRAGLPIYRLTGLAESWREIEPHEIFRENAIRLLRAHPLRAADALQLGAAFAAAERRPQSLQVMTLDERLADAARKEGFALVEVAEG